MSRSQSTQTFNTATDTAKQDQSNAQSSYGATQGDINDYKKQLSDFVSSNPYTKGGEYDQTINTGLANTSQAGADSLGGNLQSQALRTGQNSAANAATTAEYARQNQRQLSGDEATAEQNRIAGDTGYKQAGLSAATEPISAQSNLYSTSLGGGNTALGTANQAAQVPSFWDSMGTSLAQNAGKELTGGNSTGASGAAGFFGV